MQPLFAHQPVLLSVLLASLLIWRVMEASVDIRTRKRLRAGARRQDKGSHAVLWGCLIFSGRFIYTIPCRYPRCGAICSGTFLSVLMIGGQVLIICLPHFDRVGRRVFGNALR